MEIFKVKNLTFKYPEKERKVLNNISLTVTQGEFITVCGKSGCGKTTLLRNMKPPLAPAGEKNGNILFYGKEVNGWDERTICQKIGYVQQRPENQIVTDKVWHELAFGLENLGYNTREIRVKVAEMASFFGIQNWFHKDVTELSGGQKQLLNLAAVMVMQPDVLILDEPTAQLDPIAAVNFLETVSKINRELGTTVIITEHRLEEVFPMSDRIIVMDSGEIIADDIPSNIGKELKGKPMFAALPTPVQIYHSTEKGTQCPVTIREGRQWLEENFGTFEESETKAENSITKKAIIELKDIWFRYEKDSPDIVKELNGKIYEGELYAIVGGNGTGKTTALSVIGGLLKPYRGKVLADGKNIAKKDSKYTDGIVMLPQDPQTLFSRNTALAELEEMCSDTNTINETAEKCEIKHILNSHPYDLSGGEQQRLALAKVLLLNPKILLMDEPTKGFDSHFKKQFAHILSSLKQSGVTVVMVSHDVEFCARYADRCAMFFDGSIISEDTAKAFFAGKSFYTTAANRMARNIMPNAVLAEDIINKLKQEETVNEQNRI